MAVRRHGCDQEMDGDIWLDGEIVVWVLVVRGGSCGQAATHINVLDARCAGRTVEICPSKAAKKKLLIPAQASPTIGLHPEQTNVSETSIIELC
jgi:hypothetical protein